MHVTLIPYIKAAGELKSKPTQQSVAKLREIGIQPHILICRTEYPLDRDTRYKLSMFCNVPLDAVIEEMDVTHSIYEVPLMLERERLDELVLKHLRLDLPPANMSDWQAFIGHLIAPKHKINLAVVGKYIEHQDAYKSIYESLVHAGGHADTGIEITRVDSEDIESEGAAKFLEGIDGILVPGGFGIRGIEGKIAAARFAREKKIPYLGLCLGLQIGVIEFSRNVLGLEGAHSTEFNDKSPHPVIALMNEQREVVDKGGTMRLGSSPCVLREGTKVREVYATETIHERHRHRYEVNNHYRAALEEKGLRIAGTSPDGKLVEVIELDDHPWFVACQYHPEFLSKPNAPHPLFSGFVRAALGTHSRNNA